MSYSKKHTLNIDKIEIPSYLTEKLHKKINIPSYLHEKSNKHYSKNKNLTILCHQINDDYANVFCSFTCEVSLQQCRECTTCQGCEDNCQHGPCESACMITCEVNCQSCQLICETNQACKETCELSAQQCRECTTCQRTYQCGSCESTCQSSCEKSYQCGSCESYCQSSCERSYQCGSCETGEMSSCTHPDTEWTDWKTEGNNLTRCVSELICKKCKKTIKKIARDHDFKSSNTFRPYDKDFHQEIGSCPRCGTGLGMLRRHEFENGVCVKCGTVAGGGGSTNNPEIINFEVKASSNGMSIDCNISAKNAKKYMFTLYDDSSSKTEISSSGSTTTTSWTFAVIPNTTYTVKGEAFNEYGKVAGTTRTVTTVNKKPSRFTWINPPQTGKVFKDCINSREWEKLQQTINAWRNYYGLSLYKMVQIETDDRSFSIARTGRDFTYHYYNQIITSIKTIPNFAGTLPSKKTQNPDIWIARDFIAFQNAVNSFLNQEKR